MLPGRAQKAVYPLSSIIIDGRSHGAVKVESASVPGKSAPVPLRSVPYLLLYEFLLVSLVRLIGFPFLLTFIRLGIQKIRQAVYLVRKIRIHKKPVMPDLHTRSVRACSGEYPFCWRSAMQRRELWKAKLKKEAEEREIIEWHIVEIVRRYCSIPGKRVIHRKLVARYGHTISPKRVKKNMNGMRLVPSIPWRNPYKFDATHAHPQTAPENLVNQNFFIAPRRVILTDITYLYYQNFGNG